MTRTEAQNYLSTLYLSREIPKRREAYNRLRELLILLLPEEAP